MAPLVQSSVDRLLGGLDDFLKEARRSAEAAPSVRVSVSSPSASPVVNQPVSAQPPSTQPTIQPPPNLSTITQPPPNQSTMTKPLSTQSTITQSPSKELAATRTSVESVVTQQPDQQAINQAASEKWKKWKRERELKDMLTKCEGELAKHRSEKK